MDTIEFIKFYCLNILSLPLKSKSSIQIYRLVINGEDSVGAWYSDKVLTKLFNQPIHKDLTTVFVYKFCRDNKHLFLKEE